MSAMRLIAAGLTLSFMALAAWLFLMPDAPKPPPQAATAGEAFAGAGALVGSWRLSRDQAYREGRCQGLDTTEYALRLDAPKSALLDFLSGVMTIRVVRNATSTGGGFCPELDRTDVYDVRVVPGPAPLMEMTMTARSCIADGRDCPLVDRRLFFQPARDGLLFGKDRLTRVQP